MNTSATQAIREVELSLDQAKELVAKKDRVNKLIRGKDFQQIVDKGFFIDEAARLAHLLSDPSISEDIRNSVQRDINGIGSFKRYLTTIISMGNTAENAVKVHNNDLEVLRQEELEEENEAIENGAYNA